jgi:nucleoside-diphosphate-sugar epimerase
MHIAITGSSGFVGTNFIKNSKEFTIAEIDLLTQKVDEIDFFGNDAVLHLAALVHQMKAAPEEHYFKINRDLAYEVAKKAKAQGVKQFVFMSTAKVFGESTTGLPAWDENSECHPIDPYGKSKYEAEKLILGLQDEFFKVALVRSPLVYGVGVKANMYNLVKLVDRMPLLPLGGVNNRRSMVYVGNLVALLKHIIERQALGVFIAGDAEPLSTTQLTQLIAKASNKKIFLLKIPSFLLWIAKKIKPSIVDRLFGSLELDNRSTNKRLGFVPPYSTESGIQEMVEWYKDSRKYQVVK